MAAAKRRQHDGRVEEAVFARRVGRDANAEVELERERQVILQEIAMHHDTPDDLVFDLYQEMAFGDAPLGRSILGLPERVAGRSYSCVPCLVVYHDYVQILVYNHEHECWDDETGDDFKCKPMEVQWWRPLPSPPPGEAP